MDQAEEVIKWFNSHSRALAMLRDEQTHQYPTRLPLALLYPAATRWSSRYVTCARFIDIERAIRWLASMKTDELVDFTPRGRNAAETEAKRLKTREMLLGVTTESFWDGLKTYVIFCIINVCIAHHYPDFAATYAHSQSQ